MKVNHVTHNLEHCSLTHRPAGSLVRWFVIQVTHCFIVYSTISFEFRYFHEED